MSPAKSLHSTGDPVQNVISCPREGKISERLLENPFRKEVISTLDFISK